LRTIVVAIVILLVTGSSVVTVDSAPKIVSAADAQNIDGLFTEYNRPSVPGAAVAVIHDGRLAFIRNLWAGQSGDKDTRHRGHELSPRLAHEGVYGDGRTAVGPGRPADARHAGCRHHP
jgi:hypothetical protein